MNLSVIIINWNVRHLLQKCLASIQQYLTGIQYEIIVVDNASHDDSQGLLQNWLKQNNNSHVILNSHNLGFAKANNQALKIAQGEFVLFLNPDTELIDNSLIQAIEFMRQNSRIGILGGQILGRDNKVQSSVRSFPSLCSQVLILLKLHRLFGQASCLKKYFLPNFDYQKIQEVDQVMGAFLLTRKSLLDALNGFDEKFFLWFEEVDLCWRTKKTNYQIIYYPLVKIKHYGGQSFNQALPYSRQKNYNRSLIYFFRKNYPAWQATVLALFGCFSLLLSLLLQLLWPIFRNHYGPRRI
jgi:GT2 family glycosyltransferase